MIGILSRIATSYGRVRPEMAEGCPERINAEFFRYVWTYRRVQRPKLLQYLEGLRADQILDLLYRQDAGRSISGEFRAGGERAEAVH